MLHGQVLDLSACGCCFSVPKALAGTITVGRTILLSFQLEDSERPTVVEGVVRHLRDYESSHVYGLECGAIPEELSEALNATLGSSPHLSNELEALRQRQP